MSEQTVDLVLRQLSADEVVPATELMGSVFHLTVNEQWLDSERATFEPERMIGVFDTSRQPGYASGLVATAGAFTRDLTIPGGPTPAAHVSWVCVAPSHTRRGILTRMMRLQLTELLESGEPLAVLWASESAIYQRFGYGLAARHRALSMNPRDVRLRGSGLGKEDLQWAPAVEPWIQRDLRQAYDAVRLQRVGYSSRSDGWWTVRLMDPESDRDGARPLAAVVHYGADGPDGYALYWTKAGDPTGVTDLSSMRVGEFHAATPQAHGALWSFLLNVDLVAELTWANAPFDEPLDHLVVDRRALKQHFCENLWLRIVDVGRALPLRTYASAVDVVLEIDDSFLVSNAGRWRLTADASGATCVATTKDPDLRLDISALGSVFLGGVGLGELAAAGRVHEEHDGALMELAAALVTERAPHSPEIF